MTLEWGDAAQDDRDYIFGYIAADNLRAAVRVDWLIEESVGQLSHFPEIPRIGRVPDTRELVINRTPYVAVYRIKADVVILLRLLHGAQRWP